MQSKKAIIIGGGISGLSSALYLHKAGWEVTVLEKGDFTDGCSHGNAGFVCPSHYVQLATPSTLRQGFKWMLNSKSPFYIQPRLDRGLFHWGRHFIKRAKQRYVNLNAAPLRDIGLLSQREYEKIWVKELDFDYNHNGMLEVFQTGAAQKECASTAKLGLKLGLDIEELDLKALKQLEPGVRWNARGAIYYKCDGHLNPTKLMQGLIKHLKTKGVGLISKSAMTGFEKSGRLITAVKAEDNIYPSDIIVLAAGSWSSQLARSLGLDLPVVGGRGYAFNLPTSDNKSQQLRRPGLLVEGRAAFTPLGNHIRFGGTMEIRGLDAPKSLSRVSGIIKAVQSYFPDFHLDEDKIKKEVWAGFRPISVDGMPYIGMADNLDNLIVATGHSQLGISLGAATGLLVSELAEGRPTSIDISAFAPNRFK